MGNWLKNITKYFWSKSSSSKFHKGESDFPKEFTPTNDVNNPLQDSNITDAFPAQGNRFSDNISMWDKFIQGIGFSRFDIEGNLKTVEERIRQLRENRTQLARDKFDKPDAIVFNKFICTPIIFEPKPLEGIPSMIELRRAYIGARIYNDWEKIPQDFFRLFIVFYERIDHKNIGASIEICSEIEKLNSKAKNSHVKEALNIAKQQIDILLDNKKRKDNEKVKEKYETLKNS